MQKVKKLVKDELIGRTVEIIGSANKANVGICGRIVDETKNLLVIETLKGLKKVLKKTNTFQISYLEDKVTLKGELLYGAPEERIKSKVKNENRS
ncbi:ribonuclease P protein subunit [Candidatus Woesearchaeota archaeon]|nr:ribonuclease P protein subunit [Candidatus Woesearchaeota archaeon]MBW3006066.1 ribonuclease P protein subunit [Candidatus Woesearchaeota archaeon]